MKRLLLMLWCASHVLLAADQPATLPADASNGSGFRAIFDGKSLDGWDGNPAYWRVENGCIVGEITHGRLLAVAHLELLAAPARARRVAWRLRPLVLHHRLHGRRWQGQTGGA